LKLQTEILKEKQKNFAKIHNTNWTKKFLKDSFHLEQAIEVKIEVTLRLTVSQSVSQSVSMSWYRAPLWDLRPDITSWRKVAV
jgi:hypothetical protein